MAVQKENGFTPIANELLEQVYKLKLNGTQFKIIMVVWRYTYGFQRKEHMISETFIANATEVHKKQISREMNKLIQFNVLTIKRAATFTESRVVSFNKNYEKWGVDSGLVTNALPPNKIVNATANELVTSTGSESVTQERKNINKNIKKDIYTDSKSSKPKKQKHGEYKHVTLSDTEKGKLITEFGQEMLEKSIVYLDEYVEMKGYKHKSSYLVIKKWVIDAVKEQERKAGEKNMEQKKYDTGGCYDAGYYERIRNM